MISVSDIIKILDQIPIWKAVSNLPKRVAELERRLDAIEGAQKASVPEAKVCALCGSTMDVIAETPHPSFAFAGAKVHKMKCPSCDNETTRDYYPGSGYR